MILLNPEQRRIAIEAMRAYLAAPMNAEGQTPPKASTDLDAERVKLIDQQIKPLIADYLAGKIPLGQFKSTNDGINKREGRWGFMGMKGQMFFNMLVNVAEDQPECDRQVKLAISVPVDEEDALLRIRAFAEYVKQLGDKHLARGGSKQGRPKPGSIPFFLSYFWQVHDRDVWPIYYTASVNQMTALNLWTRTGDLGDDYIAFKRIQEELAKAFTEASGQKFGLYDVEHVFWYSSHSKVEPLLPSVIVPALGTKHEPPVITSRLPDSYVPPIVDILPRMARNESELAEASKASGTSLERTFEKHVNAAFTVLGYETTLMGQGQGRVPDGRAVAVDDFYAILWDAKVRTDGYSLGRDDRAIREYVTTQSRELSKKRRLRNVYYLIISSEFADDHDDAIRMLKMETGISEVCLVTAEAIVAMVDARLRDPLQVTLGSDGLQRLFSTSGIVTAQTVRDTLG
jgi:hypothetical protein